MSVVSLWEIAVKSRLGKLHPAGPLVHWEKSLWSLDVEVLPLKSLHVLADIGPEPGNKDPFDRLFLGICAAENMRLVTRDQVLAHHPLAWR